MYRYIIPRESYKIYCLVKIYDWLVTSRKSEIVIIYICYMSQKFHAKINNLPIKTLTQNQSNGEKQLIWKDVLSWFEVCIFQFILRTLFLVIFWQVVAALAVDPSGSRVLSGSYDYTVRMYDFQGMNSRLSSFRQLEPSEGHQVRNISWSPTADRFLCVTGSAQAKVLDTSFFLCHLPNTIEYRDTTHSHLPCLSDLWPWWTYSRWIH